jgi:hypothetical protein
MSRKLSYQDRLMLPVQRPMPPVMAAAMAAEVLRPMIGIA